jgi:hypothetical protein
LAKQFQRRRFFLTLAHQKQELPIRNLTGYKWSAQQDLTTLKFWRKSDYLSWSYCPFFIKFSKF